MFRQSPTPVSDGAFRRLAQKVDLELLAASRSPTAWAAPADSTARRWTGFSTRARARRPARAARAARQRPPPARARSHAGAAGRRDSQADLRAAARRIDCDHSRMAWRSRARFMIVQSSSSVRRRCDSELRFELTGSSTVQGPVRVPSPRYASGSSFEVPVRDSAIRRSRSRFIAAPLTARVGAGPGRCRSKTCRSAGLWPTCAAHFPKFKQDPNIASGIGVHAANLPARALGLRGRRALVSRASGTVTFGFGGEMMRGATRTARFLQPEEGGTAGPHRQQPDVLGVAADLVQLRQAPGLELHQRRHRLVRLSPPNEQTRRCRRSRDERRRSTMAAARDGSRRNIWRSRWISASTRSTAQEKTATRPGLPRMTLMRSASGRRSSRLVSSSQFSVPVPSLESRRQLGRLRAFYGCGDTDS